MKVEPFSTEFMLVDVSLSNFKRTMRNSGVHYYRFKNKRLVHDTIHNTVKLVCEYQIDEDTHTNQVLHFNYKTNELTTLFTVVHNKVKEKFVGKYKFTLDECEYFLLSLSAEKYFPSLQDLVQINSVVQELKEDVKSWDEEMAAAAYKRRVESFHKWEMKTGRKLFHYNSKAK